MPPEVCLTGSRARMEGSENALAGALLSHKPNLASFDLNSSAPHSCEG